MGTCQRPTCQRPGRCQPSTLRNKKSMSRADDFPFYSFVRSSASSLGILWTTTSTSLPCLSMVTGRFDAYVRECTSQRRADARLGSARARNYQGCRQIEAVNATVLPRGTSKFMLL